MSSVEMNMECRRKHLLNGLMQMIFKNLPRLKEEPVVFFKFQATLDVELDKLLNKLLYISRQERDLDDWIEENYESDEEEIGYYTAATMAQHIQDSRKDSTIKHFGALIMKYREEIEEFKREKESMKRERDILRMKLLGKSLEEEKLNVSRESSVTISTDTSDLVQGWCDGLIDEDLGETNMDERPASV